jgi:hypothetical protein
MDIQTANILLVIAAPLVGFIIVKLSGLIAADRKMSVAGVPKSNGDQSVEDDSPLFLCSNDITSFVSDPSTPVDISNPYVYLDD